MITSWLFTVAGLEQTVLFFFLWRGKGGQLSTLCQLIKVPNKPVLSPNNGLDNVSLISPCHAIPNRAECSLSFHTQLSQARPCLRRSLQQICRGLRGASSPSTAWLKSSVLKEQMWQWTTSLALEDSTWNVLTQRSDDCRVSCCNEMLILVQILAVS